MFKIINRITNKVNQYLETRVLMVKLGLIERASNLMSMFLLLLISMFVVLLIMVFLGFALATTFTHMTGSAIVGFLLTGLVFLFILFMLAIFRRPILRSFTNMSISLLTAADEGDEEEQDPLNENIN